MSIADKLSRLSDARDDIITALGNKGVIATNHGFEDFPDDIAAIVSGSGSAVVVTDTTDAHGGTIREITAVSLEGDTVTPATLLQGVRAHNSLGEAIVGTYSGGGGSVSLQTKSVSYTPSETAQTESVTADSGYDGLDQVNVSVGAVSSTYVGSGITRRSSSDLTSSGATVTAPAGYYASSASKSVASGTAGTPTATKGSVSNHSISVTPSVTNTTGYITGGTKTGTAVTVSASELVSGSETKTANGTYDVTNLAELVVNVPSSGGASNFVSGTFTTQSSAGVQSVTIPYTGSGYPIAAMVVVEGGAYNSSNTTWYNSVQRYAVGQWTMSKAVMSSSPTYSTSGTANYGVTTAVYKNSTSSSTSYTRTSAMNTNVFSSSNAANAAATCVRFNSSTSMSVYVNTSSYGLLPGLSYQYFIVYSS